MDPSQDQLAQGGAVKIDVTALQIALKNAGLNVMYVDDVVGRKFIFGDHEHLIAGTITSFRYAMDEGISLYVTCPRFRDTPIWRLCHLKDRTWSVIPTPDGSWPSITGELELR